MKVRPRSGMKKFRNRLINIYKLTRKRLVYTFLLSKIILKNYFSLGWKTIDEYSFGVISGVYFVVLFSAGYLLPLPKASEYITAHGDVLFTAAGALLAVVISIVFSFSSTLMENVNKDLPAGFYERLSISRFQNCVLWINLFVIAILFFLAAFSESVFPTWLPPQVILKASIITVSLVLWALFFSFHDLRKKIGKYNVIATIEKICLNELKKAHNKFSELAFLQSNNPNADSKIKTEHYVAAAYSRSRYNQNLIQIIDNLFDYHDKLIVSEDKGPARGVLTAIYKLLNSYIQVREKSSIAFPSGVFTVRISDSQELLGFGLENFIARGLSYAKLDNTQGIIHVVDIMKTLCILSVNVKVLNNPEYDNPVFAQCLGYFGQFIDGVVKAKSIEGMLQTTRAMSEIANSLPSYRSSSDIYSITDKLKHLAIAAFQNNYGIIVQEVIAAYRLLISNQLLNQKTSINVDLDKSFGDLLQLINCQAILGPSSGIHEELQYAYLFNSIDQAICWHVEQLKKVSADDQAARSIKHRLVEILEKYYQFIYDIAAGKVKADPQICNHLAKSIETIAAILLSNLNLWSYDRNSIIRQISGYAHLPGWFLAKRDKSQKQLGEVFTEVLCKIGIISLAKKVSEIAKQCFDTLERDFDKTLKENNLRDALDVLEKMTLLTLLADKLQEPLAGAFIEKIKKLEEDLLNKASEGIPPDIDREQIVGSYRLLNRLIMFHQNLLRDRFGTPFNISSETLLLQHVDADDVAAFIKKMWDVDMSDIVSSSSF